MARIMTATSYQLAVDRPRQGVGTANRHGGASPVPKGVSALTVRDLEVLDLMACGMSNSAIARHLFLSLKTVENRVTAIFGKLGLDNDPDGNRRVKAVLIKVGQEASRAQTVPATQGSFRTLLRAVDMDSVKGYLSNPVPLETAPRIAGLPCGGSPAERVSAVFCERLRWAHDEQDRVRVWRDGTVGAWTTPTTRPCDPLFVEWIRHALGNPAWDGAAHAEVLGHVYVGALLGYATGTTLEDSLRIMDRAAWLLFEYS